MARLRELRQQRCWTQLQMIVALQELARRRGVVVPDDRESVRVRLSSWENGRSSPNEPYLGLLAELLAVPAADLTPDAVLRNAEPRRLAAAARESLQFAEWADLGHGSPVSIDHVAYELARIAASYVHAPPTPLFADLLELRDIIFATLRGNPRPRQLRDQFFLAGLACALLAHATEELGDACSAMAQARAAWTCAEQADHDGLRAWVRGTTALISEWTSRPAEAVRLARAGQAYSQSDGSRLRLRAIEARAHARTGDGAAAVSALGGALGSLGALGGDAHSTPDDVGAFGGVLTFPPAKQHYYAGSTLVLIGDHRRAEAEALQAIGAYESSPPAERSYGDEALARVAVVTSRLAQGDLEGSRQAIGPVLALPAEQRIEQITVGLRDVAAQLATCPLGRTEGARELACQIRAFTTARAIPTVSEPR